MNEPSAFDGENLSSQYGGNVRCMQLLWCGPPRWCDVMISALISTEISCHISNFCPHPNLTICLMRPKGNGMIMMEGNHLVLLAFFVTESTSVVVAVSLVERCQPDRQERLV